MHYTSKKFTLSGYLSRCNDEKKHYGEMMQLWKCSNRLVVIRKTCNQQIDWS
jgi:hypothetical protein